MNKFGLAALLCSLASSLGLAQATVSTPIVGFQKTTIPVGLAGIGFPLLNPDIFKGSVSSSSGNTLTLSGVTNVGALLTSGEPYYIEVYGGDLKGDRFDVNTAATISAANGTVALDSSSANNTYNLGSVGASLNGVTVALRKHITVEQVGAMASPALIGNNQAAQADQIQTFNPSLNSYSTYFLRADNITWRISGTTTGANKVPIPPGVGCFIKRGGTTPTEITATGAVRQNDFALPLKSGLQLLAPGFPIGNSPATLGATGLNGWSGNNQAAQADQIQVFDQSLGAYSTYFLRGDGTTWRVSGTTTTVTSSNIVSGDSAYFVKKLTADPNYILVNQAP